LLRSFKTELGGFVKFNENSRVKIPSLINLERLGYKYLSLKNAKWDVDTNIFTEVFDESLKRLNPSSTVEEIEIFKKRLLQTLNNDDLGKAFYEMIVHQGSMRIIDFENFENNTFNCVTELEYTKGLDTFRPDISILVNGLPLVFIEVKKPNNRDGVLAERNRIDSRFANPNFKRFMNITQFMLFSNNMEYDSENLTPIQGAFYSTTSYSRAIFNCFREERIDFQNFMNATDDAEEDFILQDNNLASIKQSPEFEVNKRFDSPTSKLIISMLSKERLAFLLRYGITYVQTFNGVEKHIMRYPQIFASLAMKDKISQGQNKGIIWHTQGSGKTALAFYNTKYLTDYFQEQNKIAKFYFIVDRLDLLVQAKSEFTARGLKVNTVDSKSGFLDDFTKNQAISNQSGQLEITVVNIQKFSEEASEFFANDYSLNIQRIYFIDEAHRSYKKDGSFLANLISSDRNAILICLTGTPIIGEFASKKIFGDYFHKYYYDSSIADGYTLRLIREGIEATYSARLTQVLEEFEVQKGQLEKTKIYAHKNFVEPMLDYIVEDLRKIRVMHGDASIGGMVVCNSSDQAREMYKQICSRYPNSKSALILHDEGSKEDRKDLVTEFKAGSIDLLFVYNMLLTGFDAPRLKKIYMGRVISGHNLLQALTRVNRPYKEFKFGYVVDFADIRKEFDSTNAEYFAELQSELGDEIIKFSNLFLTKEEIELAIAQIKSDLRLYDTSNAEIFSLQVNQISDKNIIRNLVSSLNLSRSLNNVIRMMGHPELNNLLDFEKLNVLYREAQNHLSLLNLRDSLKDTADTKALLNLALEDIVFMFKKDGESELKIGFVKARVKEVREALERNIDEKDPEFILLVDELRRILEKGNVSSVSQVEFAAEVVELEGLLKRARELNRVNSLIAAKYDNDSKFARVHKIFLFGETGISDGVLIEFLNVVRHELNRTLLTNQKILENRDYFEGVVERSLAINIERFLPSGNTSDINKLKLLIAREYFDEFTEIAA
jgi:type I restriction enzyme R subunit